MTVIRYDFEMCSMLLTQYRPRPMSVTRLPRLPSHLCHRSIVHYEKLFNVSLLLKSTTVLGLGQVHNPNPNSKLRKLAVTSHFT